MDPEFPDPDEEFDLDHEDEYEVLREIEELERKKLAQSHDKAEDSKESNAPKPSGSEEFNASPFNVYKELNKSTPSTHIELNTPVSNKYDYGNIPSTSKGIEHSHNSEVDNTKKRTYDELFGDISDLLDVNGFVDTAEPKDKKPRWDCPDDIIKTVLDARDRFHEQNNGVSIKNKHFEEKKDSISLRVPRWNFVAVTRPHDAQRIYIRMQNDKDYTAKTNTQSFSNLLSVPYNQLKVEAEEIMIQNGKRASRENSDPSAPELVQNNVGELWVDKYRPRSYLELLSDESVNRNLLHWIKLWDKVVFNRNYVQSKKKKNYSTFKNKRFMSEKFTTEKDIEEVDGKGFPIQRIVLLSGPPGLGKTTLAHLAAKHAGYNVVEINASDERSPDAFRQVLLASTQMKAVMGSDPRPNCLILDEIDGAPAASIDLLLKFVQGKLIPKGKKDKGKGNKQANTCHRPVICICNEPYTPSLRALRMAALIIPVPEVSPARLADRLMEISQKENLKVNADALLRLAEISGCDVRSCLGALQYMGGANLGDNLSFALKDTRKGLFDSWKQIFTIPMNRSGILPIPERVRMVLKTVQHGESEKLAQGIFHNYPEICNEKLNYIIFSLEWFQFFDEILSFVASFNVWSVMPYTNYAFIAWHLNFAKAKHAKLSYPTITFEIRQKQERSRGILTAIHRSSGRDTITLTVDIAPFLPDLLSPRLRTVSGHLHSAKERDDIARLVNILIEYGLTFTQEKCLDGSYDYKLDPNIFEVGIFPECKHHRMLTYAVKQIIIQELEAERLRRSVNVINNTKNVTQKKDDGNTKNDTETKSTESKIHTKPKEKESIDNTKTSNILNSSENSETKKPEVKELVYKDFFGRVITVNENKKSGNEIDDSRDFLTKHGVWYKYKEGFSNAVRRRVLMEDLF
ncbi:chromosome transmission fidelity protein 18 homolog [Hylaeus anthracinus]|uniref:chromosome transmission fidelity protein 18 homolog n=1 Tax=Hylaeus anthracinus TaxID=313031 RepID=UPI0023B9CEDF|nr:chromosome transmission fidelity protein 18 homolog [Hylaeus anthracinus]